MILVERLELPPCGILEVEQSLRRATEGRCVSFRASDSSQQWRSARPRLQKRPSEGSLKEQTRCGGEHQLAQLSVDEPSP